MLFLRGERSSTKSWASGTKGERAVAKRLDALEARGILTLHDRRTPHSKWNFDHIVVGPSGVFTVDAKLYKAFLAEFRPVRR